jgi:hypothetical protein
MSVRRPGLRIIEDPAVISRGEKASFLGKSVVGEVAFSGLAHVTFLPLGREALAPSRPTAIEYLATTLGGHSRAKPVSALALEHAGLKCSFHGNNPVFYRLASLAVNNKCGLAVLAPTKGRPFYVNVCANSIRHSVIFDEVDAGVFCPMHARMKVGSIAFQ